MFWTNLTLLILCSSLQSAVYKRRKEFLQCKICCTKSISQSISDLFTLDTEQVDIIEGIEHRHSMLANLH